MIILAFAAVVFGSFRVLRVANKYMVQLRYQEKSAACFHFLDVCSFACKRFEIVRREASVSWRFQV
jgi:hypothetical protein